MRNLKNKTTVFLGSTLFILTCLFGSWGAATPQLALQVALSPSLKSLHGIAHYHLDQATFQFAFSLHHNLKIIPKPGEQLQVVGQSGLAQIYHLILQKSSQDIEIEYEGLISEPIVEGQSPGAIGENGVSLLSESYFYPSIADSFSYVVDIELPSKEWKAIVPGVPDLETETHVRYHSFAPISDFSLVADKFHAYQTVMPQGTIVRVWLRSEDAALAQQFIALVPNYIDRYSGLIGKFPFSHYSVIENSLETGYAFPGFTLLGPSVIRLPFILRSSLPHEVLHSWWGNSALVDYEKGNWCEGLTTYMADHAFRIEDGKGSEYRRSTLQGYQDFVSSEKDFPLRKFIARNDRGTQAVGYGKSMMFFQMLENLVGTSHFRKALSDFYVSNLNKAVGFSAIQTAFEAEMKTSMGSFFMPWLDQTGAPNLALKSVARSGNKVNYTLTQSRSTRGSLYVLPVKVAVTFDDGSKLSTLISLNSESQTIQNVYRRTPVRLQVDPEFEVFRHLYPEETPLSLSKVLGEEGRITVSVPAAEKNQFQDWIAGAQALYSQKIELITDDETFPRQGVVWVLGAHNRHSLLMQGALANHQVTVQGSQLAFHGQSWSAARSGVFMVDSVAGVPAVWAWTTPAQSGSVLMAKIGHYASFSVVGFTDLKNDLKETWAIVKSPLIVDF